jgi:Plant transposon protein
MSETQVRTCCITFDRTIKDLYEKEYLRLRTPKDIKSIKKLHRTMHKFLGMVGSLDCMHTKWKNCPKAWQGSFKGKEKRRQSFLRQSVIHIFGSGIQPPSHRSATTSATTDAQQSLIQAVVSSQEPLSTQTTCTEKARKRHSRDNSFSPCFFPLLFCLAFSAD